jgi:hypothetical protein
MAHSKTLRDVKFAHRRRGSSTSLSSSETLTSSRDAFSTSSSEAGDLEQELYADGDVEPERVLHAVMIPNYKEEMDTLRETLEVLGSHPQARNTYDVSFPSLFSILFLRAGDFGQNAEYCNCLPTGCSSLALAANSSRIGNAVREHMAPFSSNHRRNPKHSRTDNVSRSISPWSSASLALSLRP